MYLIFPDKAPDSPLYHFFPLSLLLSFYLALCFSSVPQAQVHSHLPSLSSRVVLGIGSALPSSTLNLIPHRRDFFGFQLELHDGLPIVLESTAIQIKNLSN